MAKVSDSVIKWMQSKQYLPPILRDFHDQKDFFKYLSVRIEQNKEANASQGRSIFEFQQFDWVKFHILTIDYFLWFMAMNGYTLQKSRKRLPYLDYAETIQEGREEWLEKCVRATPEFYGDAAESARLIRTSLRQSEMSKK